MKKRIVHLSSVHPVFDIRIFRKECRSLSDAGYDVTLIASHRKNEIVDNVIIKAVPPKKRRMQRITSTVLGITKIAVDFNADLYHFHDFELILTGVVLTLLGKKVVYDVHEDVPRDLLSRDYLPAPILKILGWVTEKIENLASPQFSATVTATEHIAKRFEKLNKKTKVINNYPILNELTSPLCVPWNQRSRSVAYVGALALERGLKEMVEAIGLVKTSLNVRLKFAGEYSPASHRRKISDLPGWKYIDEVGLLDRSQVAKLLGEVQAGLVLFHPEPNHINAQPNKMFEYMSAGIPLVASDFPLWRKVIENIGCGLLVSPDNPKEIAEAIEYLLTHPKEAEEMGLKGQSAVRNSFNWENEESKLINLYKELLGK